jgi:hypothetical protein
MDDFFLKQTPRSAKSEMWPRGGKDLRIGVVKKRGCPMPHVDV